MNKNFYKNKRVLVTGHTGFKGAWLVKLLLSIEADVYGYALEAEKKSLYNLLNLDNKITSYIGDIRDYKYLSKVINKVKPDIVFHLAAQPLVKVGYDEPRDTYEVNMMGTANLLECLRLNDNVKSIVVITTDKVYDTTNYKVYKEDDRLNGYDPYANSKSCAELISETYRRCYFEDKKVALSTVRSGNVIGGGDFGKYRIVPDIQSAFLHNKKLILRNPNSIRPYQHVLEALSFYLELAQKQYSKHSLASSYNVGPNPKDSIETINLVQLFNKALQEHNLKDIDFEYSDNHSFKETEYLKINSSKIKRIFNYKPKWSIEDAVREVVEFSIAYKKKKDLNEYIDNVIKEYLK